MSRYSLSSAATPHLALSRDGGAMEGVGAAAAAAKRVEVVVEERLSESLRENGEARCSPSECHGCACELKKPLIQIRAQGIHTSRTAKFPKGRAPHATISCLTSATTDASTEQDKLRLSPGGLQRRCRRRKREGQEMAGHPRPLFPGSAIWHGGRCGAPNRHLNRPVALVSPRTTCPSTCCRPALRTRPRAPSS